MKRYPLALALVLLLPSACTPPAGQPATDTAAATPAAEAKPEEPPVAVTARDLAKAYEENEIAADQRFKGKPIAVSGTVSGIDSDMMDKPVIRLAGQNDFMSVNASGLAGDVAAGLKKGQKVTLVCTGAGEVIGMPQLEECSLQP